MHEVVFDAVVRHARRPAIKLLQWALGMRDDGVIGPVTLATVANLDALDQLRRMRRVAP